MARKKTVESESKATETTKVEAIEPKAENIKTEETVAEPKAAEPKKAPAKKKTTKAESTKAAESAKQGTAKTPAKKVEVKSSIQIQYGGKSLLAEDLVKRAKDVWKYDLKRKAGELTSIELYVKPEENKVYYVMNDVTGSFDI